MMGARGNSELFGPEYFAHSCGRPYQRDEVWMTFFGEIADRIAQDLKPISALDAGCGMGFLVETLRNRGVEAYGIDISEYAIGQIIQEIKPYCWVASVVDPLPEKYDLVICIEVLEHLEPAEAELAVRNLCQHTDQVLFSSTPDDFTEATHFNVQTPDYWAGLFAKQGFIHDLDFDASFITPWAMLFHRTVVSSNQLIQSYELKRWKLQQELDDLRSMVAEVREAADDYESLKGEIDYHRSLEAQLRESVRAAEEEIRDHQVQLESYRELEVEIARLERLLEEENSKFTKLQEQLIAKEQIETENKRLTQLVDRLEGHLEVEQELVDDLAQELKAKELILEEQHILQSELEQTSIERDLLEGRLVEHEAHVGWRWITRFQRTRIKLFPIGSSREKIWKAGVAFLRAWLDIGLRGALKKTFASLRGRPIGHTAKLDYQRWIDEKEPSHIELDRQRETHQSLIYRPLISLITPVFNPPVEIFQEAIESILSQTYENWEWCIADASEQDSQIRKILKSYSEGDARIKVRFLEKNSGIAGNSNFALELAKGEFIALFDHDDRLAPHALYEVVQMLNQDPETDIIYFDEDKLSSDGAERVDPWFKPEWSPELLLSANYLMHSVVRRGLVEAVGKFDEFMDGAQDWDLLLRCTEKTERVKHIPKVLYHWRQVAGSVSSDLMAKPWVFDSQIRCVQAHLERVGIRGSEATFTSPGILRVTWPTSRQLVSIIIPSRDKVDLLRQCISSIHRHTLYPNYEILIVDNGSSNPETLQYYQELEVQSVRIIEFPDEFNFSAVNNLGVEHAQGDLLLFLNNDVEMIEDGWLEEMVRWAELPEIGAVGVKLLYPNGLIQHAGVIIGMQGHASHVFMGSMEKQTGPFGSVEWYRNYSAVTGACMMMKRAIFEQIGGFDEEYQLVFSDVEICIRVMKAGYRNVYTPFARMHHYEGQSRGFHIPQADMLRGYEHLKDLVEAGDAYFNPNLSYSTSIPVLISSDEADRTTTLKRLIGVNNRDN